MKKLLAVTLLMLALALAVTSCDLLSSGDFILGGNDPEVTTKAPETTQAPETATKAETTEAETTEPETTEPETTVEETTEEETTEEETTEEETTEEVTTEEETTETPWWEETTAKPRPKPQTTAEPETTVEPETTEEETTEEETTVELTAPDGYKMYQYEDIAFAYPENWILDEQYGVLVLIRDTDSGNNITLAAEPYSGLYDNMTVDMFDLYIRPLYEEMGMTLSDINIEKETVNGLNVTVIGHITRFSGQTLYQTSFYFTVDNVTYAIAVTENPPEPGLAGTVFNSIIAIGYTPEPEPDIDLIAPDGYLVYQMDSLAFLYPNTWLNVEGTLMYATPDGNRSIIVVQQDNQYAIFHTLTAQEYMDIMGPSIEAQGQHLASVEIDKTTVNGLTVTVIEQINVVYDTSVYQAMLVVTVENTTYLVVYSAPSKDADVLNTVLNSLTAID